MMTGPTRHPLHTGKIRAIDRRHHFDHPARGALLWNRVDDEVRLICAGADMTIGTVVTQSGCHDAHRGNEIVYRELLESARRDVLENLARLLWWGRRLRRRSASSLGRGPKHQSE